MQGFGQGQTKKDRPGTFFHISARFAQARERLSYCLGVWADDPQAHLLAARAARLARDYKETDRLLARCRDLGGVPEAIDLEGALARAQRGELHGLEAYLWAFVEHD